MASKFRLTGFARFFFVMIIIVPLAYFGASYFNGEDGVANLKRMIGIDIDPDEDNSTTSVSTEKKEKKEKKASVKKGDSSELPNLRKRINELEKENERLNQLLKNRDREIKLLKEK